MDQTTRYDRTQQISAKFRKSDEWKSFLEFKENSEKFRITTAKAKRDKYKEMLETVQEYTRRVNGTTQQFFQVRKDLETQVQIMKDRETIKLQRKPRREIIRLEPTAEMTEDNNEELTKDNNQDKGNETDKPLTLRQKLQQLLQNESAPSPQSKTKNQKIPQEQENRDKTTKNQVQDNTYARITNHRNLEDD